MTIDEAIKTLDDIALWGNVHLEPDDVDAIKLGIEALKRLQDMRAGKITIISIPLPGETE